MNMDNMEGYCNEMQKKCEGIENDFKKKAFYLEQNMNEYKKREDMFAA